jgi:hypothetical protein
MDTHLITVRRIAQAHGWTQHQFRIYSEYYRKADMEVFVSYTPKGMIRSAVRRKTAAESVTHLDVHMHETGKLAKVIALLGGVDTRGLTPMLVISLGWYAACEMDPAHRLSHRTAQQPDCNQRAALVTRGLLTPGDDHQLTEDGQAAAVQLLVSYRAWAQQTSAT